MKEFENQLSFVEVINEYRVACIWPTVHNNSTVLQWCI